MLKTCIVLILFSALSGCYYWTDDWVEFCQSTENNSWNSSHDYLQINPRKGQIDYHISIEESVLKSFPELYWISISGFTGGRAMNPPEPFGAMVYMADDVWININGKKIKPQKILTVDGGLILQDTRLPIDLNSDFMQRERKWGRSIFLGFPIKHPNIEENPKFHFGDILLDNESVALPEYHYCYHPREFRKGSRPIC